MANYFLSTLNKGIEYCLNILQFLVRTDDNDIKFFYTLHFNPIPHGMFSQLIPHGIKALPSSAPFTPSP